MVGRYRFKVLTTIDPQALPRLLDMFARQSLVPSAVTMRTAGEKMRVTIEQSDITADIANLIAVRMQASVLVHRAELISI